MVLVRVVNQKYRDKAAAHKATLSQVALAWLLADPVITSPIIGATSIEQLNENLGALDVKLSEDEMTSLNKITAWEIDKQ